MKRIKGDEKHCRKCLAYYSAALAKIKGHVCSPLIRALVEWRKKGANK